MHQQLRVIRRGFATRDHIKALNVCLLNHIAETHTAIEATRQPLAALLERFNIGVVIVKKARQFDTP